MGTLSCEGIHTWDPLSKRSYSALFENAKALEKAQHVI